MNEFKNELIFIPRTPARDVPKVPCSEDSL